MPPEYAERAADNDHQQTANDLEAVIEATENVDWSNVSEVPTNDVAKWTQRLQYARKCVLAEK